MQKNIETTSMGQAKKMNPTEIIFGGVMATASLYAMWCTVSLMIVLMG